MVFTQPLSVFVPDVTLIRFPNSRELPAWWQKFSSRESLVPLASGKWSDSGVEGQFRQKPEFTLARYRRCGVFKTVVRSRAISGSQKLSNPLIINDF